MADLYLARISGMAGFEKLVVVKRLAAQLAADPTAAQALFDEARIAATLSHANIVQVNDVEVVDGQVSIVMEFLHGHDVSHLIRRLAQGSEVLPIDQAVAITLGICAGLHHAHERVGSDGKPLQIVHRDVSPHNVFVTYDGAVKLVDFGIARAVTRRGKTEQGVIKGKPGYLAPETLRGLAIDRRTDVWAAGVLLYEMTTGVLPFGDAATLDQLVAVATTDAPPPSSRIANYPRDLEAIVMRALARDPDARYPTAEAMRVELDALARSRKLDLSPFRLAALMERAFAPQLAAWREAQRQGKSLADHVAAFRQSGPLPIVRAPTDIEATVIGPPPVDDTAPPRATIVAVPPMPASYSAAVAIDPGEPAASATIPDDPPARRPRRWPRVVGAIVGLPLLLVVGLAAWTLVSGGKRAASAPASPAAVDDPAGRDPAPRADSPARGAPDSLAGVAPDSARPGAPAAPAHDSHAPVAHAAPAHDSPTHDSHAPAAADSRDSTTHDPPAHDAPATAPDPPALDPAIEMPEAPAPKHVPKKKPVHKPHHGDGTAPAAPPPSSPPDPDAPLPR